MKTPQNQSRQKLSLSPKLATALGVAVVASQADAALVKVHINQNWDTVGGPKAYDNSSDGNADDAYFTIPLIGVSPILHLQHSYNTIYHPGSTTPSTTPGHTTRSQRFKVMGTNLSIGPAARRNWKITVNATMFSTAATASVGIGTKSYTATPGYGNAVLSDDNFIPVKFKSSSGLDLYGMAQVEFNQSAPGYVQLLKFWYNDDGSALEFDNGEALDTSAIPEVGGMIPTALLLGMAALVRSRRKDPLAGSLAALAAGVGGLMARANSSEEAA